MVRHTLISAQFCRKVAFAVLLVGIAGCPPTDYDLGFDDGFARDERYFQGFDDSRMTSETSPVLYRGDTIPFIEDETYEAGFQDGLWYAYNDGYFVAYRYAFIIGFSEGYDSAFRRDYLTFLANDLHVEFAHGGFSDGYNDGFSEGRVFGAFDYEAFLPLDWLDAFLDWEGGLDLFFEEVGFGTGDSGPVTLYEWGTDPNDPKTLPSRRPGPSRASVSLRRKAGKQAGPLFIDIARPLTDAQRTAFDVAPASSDRGGRALSLRTTWLERIEAFIAAQGSLASY